MFLKVLALEQSPLNFLGEFPPSLPLPPPPEAPPPGGPPGGRPPKPPPPGGPPAGGFPPPPPARGLEMKAASFPVGAVVFANVSMAIAALVPPTVVVVAMPAWMVILLGWVCWSHYMITH